MSKDVEIKNDFKNPLLSRREMTLIISHLGEGTPNRLNIRKKIASKLGEEIDKVYVRKIIEQADNRCKVLAHVYDDKEIALKIEPDYIIKRNSEKQEEQVQSKPVGGEAKDKSEKEG
ncbi:MAG: 30S ribosomal protein S24e [Candidatus Odinarchaeum yellowstonii]|uniref:Small ribosomal subunit protein eS24 n=1 Tax=Odinarchaeota yellowstonii (strain LCB_4) TaxID=1841599 RepID=A0AAF0D110_ODILC|nr:MAG: 30S ribosomal protein S24e [Candidatus Odinarchaeum yellowstonii]